MKERKMKIQNNSDNVISTGTDLDTIEPCGTYEPCGTPLFEEKLKSVVGTMQLEGIAISDETKDTLNKYADGEFTYEQIVSEWKEKHKNYPKDKFIKQTKSDWQFGCDLAPGYLCPYVTSDGPMCFYDKCDLEEMA